MNDSLPLICGLILGGGKSSRMGIDKSMIDFHGMPQRDYLQLLLKPFCHEVFFSCKDRVGVPENLNPLPDQFTLDSPLNGILSAFEMHPQHAWLTVPVDMPGINAEVIKHLLMNRNPNVMATCYYDSDHRYPEPLFVLWEPSAAQALKTFHLAGNLSPREFLLKNHVSILTYPDRSIHVNINSPDELDKFRNEK